MSSRGSRPHMDEGLRITVGNDVFYQRSDPPPVPRSGSPGGDLRNRIGPRVDNGARRLESRRENFIERPDFDFPEKTRWKEPDKHWSLDGSSFRQQDKLFERPGFMQDNNSHAPVDGSYRSGHFEIRNQPSRNRPASPTQRHHGDVPLRVSLGNESTSFPNKERIMMSQAGLSPPRLHQDLHNHYPSERQIRYSRSPERRYSRSPTRKYSSKNHVYMKDKYFEARHSPDSPQRRYNNSRSSSPQRIYSPDRRGSRHRDSLSPRRRSSPRMRSPFLRKISISPRRSLSSHHHRRSHSSHRRSPSPRYRRLSRSPRKKSHSPRHAHSSSRSRHRSPSPRYSRSRRRRRSTSGSSGSSRSSSLPNRSPSLRSKPVDDLMLMMYPKSDKPKAKVHSNSYHINPKIVQNTQVFNNGYPKESQRRKEVEDEDHFLYGEHSAVPPKTVAEAPTASAQTPSTEADKKTPGGFDTNALKNVLKAIGFDFELSAQSVHKASSKETNETEVSVEKPPNTVVPTQVTAMPLETTLPSVQMPTVAPQIIHQILPTTIYQPTLLEQQEQKFKLQQQHLKQQQLEQFQSLQQQQHEQFKKQQDSLKQHQLQHQQISTTHQVVPAVTNTPMYLYQPPLTVQQSVLLTQSPSKYQSSNTIMSPVQKQQPTVTLVGTDEKSLRMANKKRLGYLEAELFRLKKKKNDMIKKKKKQTIETNSEMIRQNSLLQVGVTKQINDLLAATDTFSKPNIEDSSSSEEETNVGYKYLDKGNHYCKRCVFASESVQEYFVHLHTKQHKKFVQSKKPWLSQMKKKMKKLPSAIVAPMKGARLLIPVQGFYCQACRVTVPGPRMAEEHCKTHKHNENCKGHKENDEFPPETKNPLFRTSYSPMRNRKTSFDLRSGTSTASRSPKRSMSPKRLKSPKRSRSSNMSRSPKRSRSPKISRSSNMSRSPTTSPSTSPRRRAGSSPRRRNSKDARALINARKSQKRNAMAEENEGSVQSKRRFAEESRGGVAPKEGKKKRGDDWRPGSDDFERIPRRNSDDVAPKSDPKPPGMNFEGFTWKKVEKKEEEKPAEHPKRNWGKILVINSQKKLPNSNLKTSGNKNVPKVSPTIGKLSKINKSSLSKNIGNWAPHVGKKTQQNSLKNKNSNLTTVKTEAVEVKKEVKKEVEIKKEKIVVAEVKKEMKEPPPPGTEDMFADEDLGNVSDASGISMELASDEDHA